MSEKHDFLLEIGTEELPAKQLSNLVKSLSILILAELQKNHLTHDEVKTFVTPRRLAILIKGLDARQPSHRVERKGPALTAAFDEHNNPSPAAQGFARSCGVSVDQLQVKESAQGAWLTYCYEASGRTTVELLPELVAKAISGLPVAKAMRWGDLPDAFVRPVHWIVLLYGEQAIQTNLLGVVSGRETRGHCFHHPQSLTIHHPHEYAAVLRKDGFVIADFDQRRQAIRDQVTKLAAQNGGQVVIEATLLDEITGLVEWPVVCLGRFAKRFLTLPKEVIVSTLQTHQKCFPVVTAEGELLPYFVTVSNIQSKNPEVVVKGNERVVAARLADAEFFYQTDCKIRLDQRVESLKHVIFQAKLGNLYDKSHRLAYLTADITDAIRAIAHASFSSGSPFSKEQGFRAGLLAKADLITTMVGEFPELQGIMGEYYARHEGESASVATAIREQYLPRFAGDQLPNTPLGCALALAERLDTLVGIFGIQQQPTGDKDPFGLRRAALGVLRILVEKQLPLDLQRLLEQTMQGYQNTLHHIDATQKVRDVFYFIIERFRTWYQEQGVTAEVFAAVLAKRPTVPVDFDQRIKAVSEFFRLPQAKHLIAANKRVRNLLVKEAQQHIAGEVDTRLFETTQEQHLLSALHEKKQIITPALKTGDYTTALIELAALQTPVDQFFDHVMVMVDKDKIRDNRLKLLAKLRDLFLEIADISLLQ